MLHFEGSHKCPLLKPQDIYILDRFKRDSIKIERQFSQDCIACLC